MKHLKTLSFFIIIAITAFCLGCGGGGNKYPDVDDEPVKTDDDSNTPDKPASDEDADTNGDTPDNVTDDADTASVSDDDTGQINDDDEDELQENDEDADEKDNDSDKDDTDRDEDNTNPDEDTDDEQPDIDEKEDPAVLCTGQTKCFNTYQEISCNQADSSFYGQDGLYSGQGYCLPKVLNASGELVTDAINGLVWQRNLPSKYDGCTGNTGTTCLYEQAVEYCDNLEYAGYNDWRLPSPEEFGTIIDYGRQPAIDSDKLPIPKTSNKAFWTRTKLVSENASNTRIWYVNFANGEITNDEDKAKYVRCVRGSQLEKPQFKITNEIIEDTTHNLIWTKDVNEVLSSWESALSYCQNLEYGGYNNWRLPSINELASLIDYSQKEPASLFPDLTSTYFWSSTSANYIPNAWTIMFSTGRTISTTDKTNTAKIICVR